MTTLFDPITLGDIALSNRIAMAPLTRNRAPNAVPTPLMATYYAQRASAGLLITEATAISHQGQGYADVPGLYAPEQIAGWKKVTSSVHAAGGKIVVQLWHVGRVSHTDLQPGNAAPVAPSAIQANTKTVLIQNGVPTFTPTSMPRALELAEIPGIVADYRRAARAAIEAGFDGVEIHAANGYLIDQFLKTGANQRTDAYGGSIENRSRLLLEVVKAVTDAIGAGRTGLRISPTSERKGMGDENPGALAEAIAAMAQPPKLQEETIHIGPGTEDIVLDTLNGQQRLLVSCSQRRKDLPVFGEIVALNLANNSKDTLSRSGEPAGLTFHPHGIDLVKSTDGTPLLFVVNHRKVQVL